MDACPEFIGNSDFYGLGIRIGVYLQWMSARITLLLDPESAQATFDANSTFVFAIVIATIIAARQGADAIEMYLMLQFMLGFFVTTLSTLGVRLWLMSPDRLSKLVTMTKALEPVSFSLRVRYLNFCIKCETLISSQDYPWIPTKAKLKALLERIRRATETIQRPWRREKPLKDRLAEWARKLWTCKPPVPKLSASDLFSAECLPLDLKGLYLIWHLRMESPLKLLSPLKPPGLSWSGVVWRTATASMIAAYNLAFWFDSGNGAQQPARPGCERPYIFLFSKQQLQGSVVVVCHAAAVIIAVFVFPAALILLLLTTRLFLYACLFLYRDLIYLGSPQVIESLREALTPLTRINTLI